MPSIDRILDKSLENLNSPEITRTTAGKNASPKIPSVVVSKQVNPLHQFRSYNYLFTLACIKSSALKDPDLLRKTADYYVIAKSSGKGTDAIKLDSSFNVAAIAPQTVSSGGGRGDYAYKNPGSTRNFGQEYIDAFNARSSGRFDLFINNVEIETLMSASQAANTALATKIKFEIYEPYSLNGFMEAIQTAALAAGHVNYAMAPFVLKMEFIGYPDTDGAASETIKKLGAEGTRYFVFSFTNLTVDATESGTRYQCEAVPHNERAFGKSNELTANIKITGKTVGDILADFSTQINRVKEEESKKIRGEGKPVKSDKYNIILPSWSGPKMDITTPNAISKADVTSLTRTNNNYKFADPGSAEQQTVAYVPGKTEVQFSDTVSIHDCISAIIRDSEYTKNLIKQIEGGSKTVIVNGMVDYFLISIEAVPQGVWDEETKRELYTYTYLISPYKIHYTRIPLYESKTIDSESLKLLARREYNYLYTGKNIDVQSFNLKFDNLYFQAIPSGLGNNNAIFSSANGQEAQETSQIAITGQVTEATAQRKNYADAPIYIDTSIGTANPQKGSGNKPDNSDPYTSMVVNMHQAILDNLSMISAEIKILGDPFFLVTGGMGNYKPAVITYGETVDNEAAYQQGDVFVVVNFRNPIDIDPKTGLLEFNSTLVPFSGVFRVISVISTFKDGLFEQRLQLLRVPGQPIDTNQPVDQNISPVTSTPNPSSSAIANFVGLENTFRLPVIQPDFLGSGGISGLISGTSLLEKFGGNVGQLSGVTERISGVTGQLTGLTNQLTDLAGQGRNLLASGVSAVNNATSALQKIKEIPLAISEINKLAYGSILEDATSAVNTKLGAISITGITDSLKNNMLPEKLDTSLLTNSPISRASTILASSGATLSSAGTQLLDKSGANSVISVANQLAVGSAEVINRTIDTANVSLNSVAVQFGSKSTGSPLVTAITKPQSTTNG